MTLLICYLPKFTYITLFYGYCKEFMNRVDILSHVALVLKQSMFVITKCMETAKFNRYHQINQSNCLVVSPKTDVSN